MDISSLRERNSSGPLSVSEINGYLKSVFESDSRLRSVSVQGEISNFVRHKSGHLYFSLKDEECQIKAVMFRSSAESLRFNPENGMRVIVRGSVTVYTRDGGYQIYVSSMQPDGIGALYVAYERLKERLCSEGLFDDDHKLPIPRFPQCIGVITSPSGAAIRDIINVATRRMPSVKIYLYPSLVQGDGAEEQLVRAVDYFDRSGLVDLVIIGRGGGSIEDLWAFNSEKLARRIYSASVPIISGVGHQTDFTICDFVSDMRAPTPSGAAELAVPDYRDLLRYTDNCTDRCERALVRNLERAKERLDRALSTRSLSRPISLIEEFDARVDSLVSRAEMGILNLLERKKSELSLLAGKAEALSPLSVLSRGYSVVESRGSAVSDSSELSVGQSVDIVFSKGRVNATVNRIEGSVALNERKLENE